MKTIHITYISKILIDLYFTKYQDHVPCSFACILVCVDDQFTKPIVVLRGKTMVINLLKQFLKSLNTVQK